MLHRQGGFVACHHCGHRERGARAAAPACASVTVARHGAGTERIEHELRDALGGDGFPVFRLDADAVDARAPRGRLQDFAAAPAGVLVGTQMVAKGHDFPDVSLGVVLDADQTLRFPDFRAEERTFALVTQLAGRTGRGDRREAACSSRRWPRTPARSPTPSITTPTASSPTSCAAGRRLSYPPFASLIRIVCSAVQEAPARETAAAIAARLPASAGTVLGPAPLFRLRGRARSQLVVKASDRAAAIAAAGEAVDALAPAAARQGTNVSVDVDPQ